MAVEVSGGPVIGIDRKLFEVIVDGERFKLTHSQWRVFVALWDAHGAFLSTTILSGKTQITAIGLRYHVRLMRLKLGARTILTHENVGFGYRLNID